MKSFTEFLSENKKKKDPILITAQPTHGAHSVKKTPAVLITAQPTHGAHSKPRKPLKEEKHLLDDRPDREYSKQHSDDKTHKDWRHQTDNHHIGKDVRSVHYELTQHSTMHWYKHKNASAIRNYTDHSHDINKHLIRKAEGKTWDKTKKDQAHRERSVKKIDSVLNHHTLPHDVHVYHGTTAFNPGKEAAKHPDGHIKLPGYTSTSHDKQQAYRFGGRTDTKKHQKQSHIIHIHAKKGTKGIYVGENSEHPHEHEVLLHRNMTLKIHPKPTLLKHPKTGHTHVWHAEIVHHGPENE